VRPTNPAGYRTQSEDTSYEAEQALFEHWRSLEPHEKARIVARACQDLHRLCLAGLAHRLPEAGPRELELRALALKYGPELVRRLLGVEIPPESVRIP
jgi:hypothetical protein